MLARCWLHIGVEKTGTTSIQRFLAANRKALRTAGRLYPLVPGPVSHPDLVCFGLDDARSDRTRKQQGLTEPAQVPGFRTNFQRALNEEIAASRAEEIIFSNELLSTRLRSPAELARIKSLCAAIACRTKVVVYLRNQVDFLVSRYTTVIQHGGKDEFRVRGTAFVNYARLLDRWATAFGRENLIVRRFEPADFAAGDLIADFSAVIGLDHSRLVRVPRYNESLDAESLAFFRALNSRLPSPVSERITPLRMAAVNILQRRRGGTRFVIPPRQAGRIEDHFRASNEKVSADYFGSRHQPLFSPPALVGHADEIPPRSIGFGTALRITGVLIAGLVSNMLMAVFSRRSTGNRFWRVNGSRDVWTD